MRIDAIQPVCPGGRKAINFLRNAFPKPAVILEARELEAIVSFKLEVGGDSIFLMWSGV